MIKKFLASLAIIAFAIVGLSACGSEDTTPKNLNGTYVSTGDVNFVGEVQDGTILVNIQGRDSEGLYWSGDFAKIAKSGDKINSHANKEQLATSMTGSMDSTKEFTVDGDKLVFKMTALGVTKTIELEKNSSYTN